MVGFLKDIAPTVVAILAICFNNHYAAKRDKDNRVQDLKIDALVELKNTLSEIERKSINIAEKANCVVIMYHEKHFRDGELARVANECLYELRLFIKMEYQWEDKVSIVNEIYDFNFAKDEFIKDMYAFRDRIKKALSQEDFTCNEVVKHHQEFTVVIDRNKKDVLLALKGLHVKRK